MLGISIAVSPGQSGLPGLQWLSSSLVLPAGMTLTRSGTSATSLYGATWATAVVQTYAANAPRFTRFADESVGLMIEGARTNLALRSGEMGNGTVFTKTGITTADNVHTAPSGTAVAERYYPSSSTGNKRVVASQTVTSGQAYSYAVYAKQTSAAVRYIQLAGGTSGFGANAWANFDLLDGDLGTVGSAATALITALPNGWYRCEIRITATASTTDASALTLCIITSASDARQPSVSGFSGNATDDVGVWGLQWDAAAFRASLLSTSGSTTSRVAESLSRTVTLPPASVGFSVRLKARTAAGKEGDQYLWSIDDGTANNRYTIRRNSSGNLICEVVTGSSTVASLDMGAVADSTVFTVAATFATNSVNAALNGVAATRDTSCAMPTVSTERWGHDHTPANHWFGHVLEGPANAGFWRAPADDTAIAALAA